MKFMRAAIAMAGVSAIASIAWAQNTKMSSQDFPTIAASSDMFEIHSSELALQRSQTAAVKEFVQMMINDHTTSSKNLSAAAKHGGVIVPTEMTMKHASQVEELSAALALMVDFAESKAK